MYQQSLVTGLGLILLQSCASTSMPAPTHASWVQPGPPASSQTVQGEAATPAPGSESPSAATPSGGPTIDDPKAPESAKATTERVEEPSSPWEKYSVALGGLFALVSSDVRFGPAGVGVEVNLEDLLGLKSTTNSYRFEGSWRFTDNLRHRVGLSWIDLVRSGELTTQKDVDIGDTTIIPAGSGIRTGFRMNLIRTDYSYSFLQDDRVDLAAVFGLYVAPLEATLETTSGTALSDKFNVTAPLPLLGMRMDVALTPKWYLRSNISLFYVEYDGYTGSMNDIVLATEYRAWKHVAIGLGLDSFNIGVEHNGESSVPGIDKQGKIDFGYTGLMLYVKGLW